MPFRLKAGESVSDGLKRIVAEEIESAVEQLNGAREGRNRDEAIHEARKSVKKVRSVLRLLRAGLGGTYKAENTRLQAVGRRLSAFRDGTAVIEVFDGMTEKYERDLDGHNIGAVRAALVARKEEAERKPELARALRGCLTTLRYVGGRVDTWPIPDDGFGAIAPGLERVYRQGRRALARARKDPAPENYHEWRKRAKDHWYHMRLLEELWTPALEGYERNLKQLETWLGDDHNLVVLRGQLDSDADSGFVRSLIDRYQKELRENSLSLGERLYEEKPRRFTKRMKHLWRAWEAQPAGLLAAAEEPARPGKPPKAKAGSP